MLLLWQSGPPATFAAQSVGCVVVIPSLSHPFGFGSTPPPDPAPSLFRLRLCDSHYSFTDDDAAIAVELSLSLRWLNTKPPLLPACF